MLDLSKPLRITCENNTKVVLIKHGKSSVHDNREMLFLLATDRTTGSSRVMFRTPEGRNPSTGAPDLININVEDAARAYQTMASSLAVSLKILWENGYHNQAVDVVMQANPRLNRAEVHYYFEGLFG